MQNEFEKQVRQKMEELRLVPTDPVWQKVELRIRQKKDRRRLFLWLPLAAGLLSVGLWWALNHHADPISPAADHPTSRPSSVTPSTVDQKTVIPLITTKETVPQNSQAPGVRSSSTSHINNRVSEKSPETKTFSLTAIKNLPPEPTEGAAPPVEDKPERTKEQTVVIDHIPPPVRSSAQRPTVTSEKLIADSISGIPPKHNEAPSAKDTLNRQTADVPVDSAEMQLPSVRKQQTKWRYAAVVRVGISGAGRMDVLGGQKSMDAGPTYASYPGGGTTGNAMIRYGSSDVKKGFSFSAGGAAVKSISKRTQLSVGLQYVYYSNTIDVGTRINSNTVIRDYAVTEYYSNRSTAFGFALQEYLNQYHFVSLPLAIKWQLLKKRPLHLDAGLSLQQLVKTNALVFDYNRQAYFHNEKAFHQTQLFTEWGLGYAFPLQKNVISVGPQLQYGLSRLEKDNAHHLFSMGVKAQFLFNNK